MRTSLLEYYQSLSTLPPGAAGAAEKAGVRLGSAYARSWDTVQDFLDGYCRDLAPAGVLVLASDPAGAGASETGIALTDSPHARRVLDLPTGGTLPSRTSGRFWDVVHDVRRAMGEPALEALFSTVHLAHAFPFHAVRVTDDAPADAASLVESTPRLQRVARDHVKRLLKLTRPQAVACIGRFAFEAAASCADNSPALAASVNAQPWDEYVAAHTYGPGLAGFPFADYRTFRARLLPLDLDDPRLEGHARDTLGGLLADAWT